MAADKKQSANSIPIRFVDSDEPSMLEDDLTARDLDAELTAPEPDSTHDGSAVGTDASAESGMGGPELAELIASRAELKRLQTTLAEAQETSARRQADFQNYRKRVERDRGETHDRIVADTARK